MCPIHDVPTVHGPITRNSGCHKYMCPKKVNKVILEMSLDNSPQCSACKIATSLMWRKGNNGDVLCNSCHLKRVNTSIRIQRQSSKESKKLVARIKASTRKGYNGKSGERSRGRRALQRIKRKVSLRNYMCFGSH